MKIFKFIILALVTINCGGDSGSGVPQVAKEVDPFVQHFIEVARSYGKIIDKDHISISFINSHDDFPKPTDNVHAVARCYLPSKKILIDKQYWISQYKCWGRREDMHKLIFHELAHCHLGISHHNDEKVNGISASVMATKDKSIPEDVYSKNFKSYMDQLFLGKTPTHLYDKWDDVPHQLDADFLNDMFREDADLDKCTTIQE